MSAVALARDAIAQLTPYSSARDEGTVADVMLDANESPFPTEGELNRYPEPQPYRLVSRLCRLYGVTPEQLLVARRAAAENAE